MDKKIRKIRDDVDKKLTKLAKEDQKRDPACHLGEKMMKKKKK